MNTYLRNAILGTIVAAALAVGSSCGEVSENDFGQTLTFDGFFADEGCGTGLAGVVAFLDLPAVGGDTNCTLGQPCIIAVQVTNNATGSPIPSSGGQGASGQPVPTTEGVRILPRNIHIEYLLPIGQLPARDFVQAGNILPGGDDCREFSILNPEDTVTMIQDPLSFPNLPFFITARVTYEGITSGGLDIRTQGEIFIQVFGG